MNKKKRELTQNELVESIESNYEKIKPYVSKIVMFTTIAILGVIAIAFWRFTKQSANESAWREYISSTRFNDSRGYDFVAENYSNTTPGQLAVLSAGDADYGNAMSQIIQNRPEYNAKLKKAADRFKQIVEGGSNSSPQVKLRATYSLAYAYEGLGKFSDAKKLYEEIIDTAPNTPESELAEKSLARVTNPKLTSIYAAFQAWEPPATAPDAPGTGISLPERPVLDWNSPVADNVPDTNDDTNPDEGPAPDANPDSSNDANDPAADSDDGDADKAEASSEDPTTKAGSDKKGGDDSKKSDDG